MGKTGGGKPSSRKPYEEIGAMFNGNEVWLIKFQFNKGHFSTFVREEVNHLGQCFCSQSKHGRL